MRILVFSDIHGDTRALEKLVSTEADYYFAAGDTVTWSKGFEKVGPILQRRAEKMYVMPGNHESEADIEQFCADYGLHNFHGGTLRAGDWTIAGLGGSSATPFNTPTEYSEEEFARRLQPFAGLDPLVLICHCPPLGTVLDKPTGGPHAGSQSVRDFLEKHQPAHFFCGHIHEAEGLTIEIGRTRATNAGKRGSLLEI